MTRTMLPWLGLLWACGHDAKPAAAESEGGCEAVSANFEATCGEDGYPLDVCEADQGVWLGAGCDDPWQAYTSCEASSKPDCEEGGAARCEPKLDALFACQSQFVRRTGCTAEGYHEMCTGQTPYAIFCLNGAAPDKRCVPLEDGGNVPRYCCP